MSQLTQTLDFASDDAPSAALKERVGLGLLGLQEYAHEYWISHVLHYAEAKGGPLDQQSPLLTQLSKLAVKHTNLIAQIQLDTLPGISESIDNPIQNNISEKLQVVPELHSLMRQVLDFRHKFDVKQASEDPGKSRNCGQLRDCANRTKLYIEILATDWDPTLFSRANWKYNGAVKSLLCASSWVGLSSTELQAFQSEYRRTAFICTVRSCERSRFGYPSAVELEDHKTRQHTAGFKCYYSKCPYNDIGFTSSRSLRAHEKRVHLRDLPAIPKMLKRKYPADGSPKDMGATEAPGFVPQGPQLPPDQQPLSDASKQETFFGHYASQFIQNHPYVGSGWQADVTITERVGKTQTL